RWSTTGERRAGGASRGVEPRKLRGAVRGEQDWIAMKALEKDRERRYDSAHGLAADVERYLREEPVLAGPPSAWYRARKLAGRHKLAAALLALAAGALPLASGVSWLFAAGDQREADREGREKERAWLHLYVARMQAGQQAWRDGDVNRLRELLDETRPGPGQPDLRGFE